MKSTYVRKCLELPPEERNDFWCIVQHMVRAWRDPKYDADAMLCLAHIAWAFGMWCAIRYPHFFNTPSLDMALQYGHPFLWWVVALALGIGHYFSIFLRKPILRIPFFLASLIWGMALSSSIYYVVGANLASLIYIVLFVYIPMRKIVSIIRTSIQDFKEERLYLNKDANSGDMS